MRPATEKGALALARYGRRSAEDKAQVLALVNQAQTWNPALSLTAICDQLGLSRAKFYRWQTRQEDGQLADQVVVARRQVVPPTPLEVTTVRDYAQDHPELGYKRLAWTMVD